MLKVTHDFGFFSCCYIRLERIVQYFNEHKQTPCVVDSTSQFSRYKTFPEEDITTTLFTPNDLAIPYVRSIDITSSIDEPQFSNYQKMNFEELTPFIRKYFSVSNCISDRLNDIKRTYDISPTLYCGIRYRGNDKCLETNVPSYQELIQKASQIRKLHTDIRFIIHSDDLGFVKAFQKTFPLSLHIKETDTITHLAAITLFSELQYVVTTSGNAELFMVLYRGHTNGVFQYLNRKSVIYEVPTISEEALNTPFWYETVPCKTNFRFINVHTNSIRNIYLSVDDPYMQRPSDVAEFIAVQCEPQSILHLRDSFIQNHRKFDVLLTYDEEVLKECSNARLCLYGTTIIPSTVFENIDVSRKQRAISSLTGWKKITDGHNFRQVLYYNQLNIHLSVPVTWFRSDANPILDEITSNPIVGPDKSKIFLDYQFSLVIENSRQKNYFTEKLIDCLITKTIPIYYGCPNIGEWFDTSGWIIIETPTIEEFIAKCIDLPKYCDYLSVIENNYIRSKEFTTFESRIKKHIDI